MDMRVIIILAAEAALAFCLIYRTVRPLRLAPLLCAALLTAAAFAARYLALDYVTLDYRDFLSKWVDYFRNNGGFRALDQSVGNYNIPYLYFLAAFSYSDINDLYLIKLLSIFFDVLLAYGSALVLSRLTESKSRIIACFFTVLMLPTVFLNGSLWGQCDSTYAALAILGIYCALDGRPVLSMILAALSFGFKLQAVFVLPVYAVLWMKGKFKLRHFAVFPAAYILLVLPAVLLGRPFLETITLYFNQTGSIGSGLNYNSPSIYSMFQYSLPQEYNAAASALGIIAAAVYMTAILVECYVNRNRLTEKSILAAALLFAIGIPFLLPHMHDRYFFAADILSVITAFAAVRFSAIPLLVQFASLLGYHAYLKLRYLLLMDRGAWALIAALILSLWFFASALERKYYKFPYRKDA
mgnify:FL=1